MEEDLISSLDLREVNNSYSLAKKGTRLDTVRLQVAECTLFWKNVSYSIRDAGFIKNHFSRYFSFINPPNSSDILYNISGYAEPGKFLAIIGASGVGKTSLIDLLANRKRSGKIEGIITVNGENIKKTREIPKYTALVGYVRQNYSHLPFLTVRETMFYAGMLVLPRTMSTAEKLERIKSLMNELGLDKCANSIVGNRMIRGISGGELKRLSIGVELLRNPSILLLDEPTTGLDANTSLQIIQNLKILARKYHHTIITAIHQPRSHIFNEFDNLLILAEGGRQIYFGAAKGALDYFENVGYRAPKYENPGDFIIDLTGEDFTNVSQLTDSVDRINYLVDSWDNTDVQPRNGSNEGIITPTTKKFSPRWITQVFWLIHRETINELRSYKFNITRFIQYLVLGLFIGWLFFRLGDTQSTINERTSLIYMSITIIAAYEMLAALTVFLSQREILYRERDSGFYPTSAYWLAKQLSLLPFQLFYPAVFIFLIYWLSGLQTVWYKFGIFFGIIEFVGLYCSSFGLVIGAFFPPSIAITLGPFTTVLALISSGFLVNFENIVIPIRYVTYLSFTRWAYEALLQNEMYGLTFTCTSSEKIGGVCPITTGSQVISRSDISELDYYFDFLFIFIYILFFKIMLYFVLKSRNTGS